MVYEFQTKHYQTADDMCRALASEWLCPDCLNDRERMLAFLADATDEELADAAIEGLGLNFRDGHTHKTAPPTGMEQRGVTRDDIVRAFACVRTHLSDPVYIGI